MQKLTRVFYKEEKDKKISDYKTSFVLEPLERGFANTIGIALRRTLLSSVTSIAPFAVRIEDVNHEFSSIDFVEEDVVRLLNNIKKVKFVFDSEIFKVNEPIKVFYDKEQEGDVTANDLTLPPGLKIVNGNQLIAKVKKIGVLKFEIYLLVGRGFVSFEENKKTISEFMPRLETKLKSGKFIAIDSDFSPVTNVNFEVVELNSASNIIQEKLEFNIQTDGTVVAKDAIAEAAKILMVHLKIVSETENLDFNEQEYFIEKKVKEEVPKAKLIEITELNLTVRSLNALKRTGFKTLLDLEKIDEEELHNIKNLGKKSIQEILDKLKEHGIVLKKKGD
ncbi:DNA-directed RNA polymerase subunit alpha [Mesomycoplasma neurolyticum]|uniref:DNA-directed RNA polymerase subunit alpha n=1 Tax=Mesomycoplasma neurolyticum TaxID=2120 RepID=A0A449A666_9BACT|nr:DNA-directed RNA polymerase subunit alpha [Mesomycoplasma neurolyticum]VEU59751.1 DNA-directed RNA polymerase subunit alpha [Mesomycoplasma neurolyticum]